MKEIIPPIINKAAITVYIAYPSCLNGSIDILTTPYQNKYIAPEVPGFNQLKKENTQIIIKYPNKEEINS
jgi:hypothetical protein